MSWTELNFGEYKGKTLPQVLFTDPDWFFWAMEKSVFKTRPSLKDEAERINMRARKIKIPKNKHSDPVVQYFLHHPTMKFSHFEIVPREQQRHEGSSPAFRSDVIDMSVPHRIAKYDKTGGKSLLRSLKYHVFGSESARITKARAEAFFDDASNFA